MTGKAANICERNGTEEFSGSGPENHFWRADWRSRAALDWTIEHGVPHDGWRSPGRRVEDGQIDGRYQLKEAPSSNHLQRIGWNARDSDGTVIFSKAEVLTSGSKKTVELARKHRRPVLRLSKASGISVAEAALRRGPRYSWLTSSKTKLKSFRWSLA